MTKVDIPGKVVSATAFVRNFGEYARTAASEPIHILNHGRPAWTLVAAEYFARSKHNESPQNEKIIAAYAMVLDAMSAQVIFVDANLNVVATNPSARHGLGLMSAQIHGHPLTHVMTDLRYEQVLRAVHRVRATGIAEMLEVDMQPSPLRSFQFRVESCGTGYFIMAEETTAATLIRERHEKADAYELMMDALPGFARGAINSRGNLVSSSIGLAGLMMTDSARITNVRLSSLFHTTDRTTVADAIDTVLSNGSVATMHAALQAGGTGTIPVTLTVTPYAPQGRNNGAFFLIQRQAA